MSEQLKNTFFPNTLKRAGHLCLLIVFLLSSIGLVVWMLNTHILTGDKVKFIPMSPITAITFTFLIAVMLTLIDFPQKKYSSLFSYSIVLFILVVLSLKLLEFFMQFNFGFEGQILPNSSHFNYVAFGRMSPVTAISFFITALSILFTLGSSVYLKRAAGYFLTIAIGINLIVIVGYAFGTPLLYNYVMNGNHIIPIALTTAFSFIFLCTAVITILGVDYFPLRPIVGTSTQARLLRAFLPLTLGFVLFDGVVYSIVSIYGIINHAIVSSLISLFSLAVATLVIFRVSRTIGGAIDKAEEEQKKAEDTLRENEVLFETTFANAPSGMALVNLQGRFLKVNAAWCNDIGYSSNELCTMTFMDITHPEDLEISTQALTKLAANKIDEIHFEKRYRHKLGHYIWVLLEVSLIKNNEGKPLYNVSQLHNISKSKGIQDALRQSEELFKKAFNFAPTGMALVDMDGNYLQVNGSWCTIIGYEESELLNKSSIEITHPLDLDASHEKVLKIVRKEITSFSLVKRYIHKSGKEIWANVTASVVVDKEVNPLYMIMHINDITVQKKTQEALRESEDRFRTLAEANFEGIAIHEKGIILDVNYAFAEMFGYDLKEIIGKQVGQFVAKESHDVISQNIKSGYNKPYEAIGLRKDGSTFPGELVGKTLPYKDRIVRVTAIHDITLRRETEFILRESEQRYRLMFENNPTPMWVYDIETLKFLDVNNALVKYYGYSKSELLSMTIKDMHSSEEVSLAVMINKMSKNTDGINLTGEWKLKRKDGSFVYTEIISHSFVFDHRQAKLVIANDITDRKNAEENILKSEKRFRALVERSSDFYLIINQKGRITYAAPSTLQIVGYTQAELISSTIFDIVHPDDIKNVTSLFSDILQTPGVPFKGLYRAKHKSGKWLWMESVSINLTEDPNINGIIVNSRDVNDKKRAEEEAELMKKVKNAIGTSEMLSEALKVVLQEICVYTDWVMGEAWLRSEDDLKRATYWHTNEEKILKFNLQSEKYLISEISMIKDVWDSGKMVVVKDLAKNTLFKRKTSSSEAGIKSAFFMPIMSDKAVIAVVNFFMNSITEEDEKLIHVISIVGDRIGAEVHKKGIKDKIRFQSTILQGIGESVIATDLNGIITYWNQSSTNLYGYSGEEAIGQPLSIIYSEKHKESVLDNVKYILDKKDFIGVRKFRHKDGTLKYVDIKTSKFIDEEGKVIGIIGVQKDITERIRIENAFKTSEERFSKVFKASPIGISISTLRDNRYIDVNESFIKITGIKREKLIGKRMNEIPEFHDYINALTERQKVVEELRKENSLFNPVLKLVSPKKPTKYFQIFTESIDVEGELCSLAMINDITEQKQAEEALKTSEERFSKVFKASPIGIAILSIKDSRYIDINEAYVKIIEKKREDILGKRMDEIVGKRVHEFHETNNLLSMDSKGFREKVMEELKKSGIYFIPELKVEYPHHQTKYFRLFVQLIEIEGEQCSLTMMNDITALKSSEKALDQSQESFQILFDQAPLAICIFKEGIVESVNKEFLQMFGYNDSLEVKNKHISSLLSEETISFILRKTEKRNGSHGISFSYTLVGINNSGNAFPIHISIAQMQLPDGVASIAYIQNITDWIEANTLLEESQQSLTSLVCNLPGMVYRCKNDKKETMEFVSEGSLDLTGYSSSDFIIDKKVTYNDIIHPDDRKFVRAEIQKALAEKKPFILNYRIVTASGKTKQVWEQGSSILLPDGRNVLEGFITNFNK